MKVAIIGSRSFTDYTLMEKNIVSSASMVISGGARGADSLAEKYAQKNNIPIKIILPKFKTDKTIKYHPRWYLERNKQIVDMSDIVIAFWDSESKGTAHTINYAQKTNKEIKIIHY